jgi:CIC family chloride channel protein
MGLLFPQLLGIGYGAIDLALTQELSWGLMFLLVIGKILATFITISSGGIYAPSLFVGAMADEQNETL